MAEWKTRGYVPDSDEEDESQTSFEPNLSHNRPTFASSDDNQEPALINRVHVEISNKKQCLGTGFDSTNEDESSRSRKVEIDDRTNVDFLAPPHEEEQRALLRIDKNDRECSNAFDSVDDEEIDELQEDYYQDIPAASSEKELRFGAQDLASPALPNQSSPPTISSARSYNSTLPSDPPDRPLELPTSANNVPSDPNENRTSNNTLKQGQGSSTALKTPSHAATDIGTIKAARALRHRNPIQLHPYAIESERYRQTCKATGVKPLRIAQMEAEAANVRQEESQNAEYPGEGSHTLDRDSDPDDSAALSPRSTQQSLIDSADKNDHTNVFGDDELPDLEALISNPPRKYVGNGHKRRKIASNSFRMPAGMSREIHRSSLDRIQDATLDDDDVSYEVPLSPPVSGSQTPTTITRTSLPNNRTKHRISKVAIPTPVTSSEPRKSQVLEISEDELSDDPSTSSDQSSSGETSSTQKVSSQLQRVQRKIRGVLPASWLKIDLKSRKKHSGNPLKAQRSPSLETSPMRRGVARPIVLGGKNPNLSTSRDSISPLSESEDSASESNHLRRDSLTRRIDNFDNREGGVPEHRWGEATESDRIDAMLPSSRMNRQHRKQEKTRQARISDPSSNSRPLTLSRLSTSQRDRKDHQRTAERFDKGRRRKPKSKPPKLGILDSPSLNTPFRNAAPPFVKIASRAVRSRKDKGRHSPSRKYLRLATKFDTEDSNSTLHDWREGKIAPVSTGRARLATSRKPLQSRSANSVTPPQASNLRSSRHCNGSARSNGVSHRPSFTSKRKLQSSLDHIIQRETGVVLEEPENVEPHEPTEQSPKRRQLVSSVRDNCDARPAMLEGVWRSAQEFNAQEIFRQDLSRIDHFTNESGLANVLRLLKNKTTQAANDNSASQSDDSAVPQTKRRDVITRNLGKTRKKKTQPKHLDVSIPWSRESSSPIFVDDLPDSTPSIEKSCVQNKGIITGLGSFGVSYSDDFGITALPIGTCFHESTFLGSGAFAKSLKLGDSAALDNFRGYAFLQFEGRTHRWGPWNDLVSSEIGEVTAWISQSSGVQLTQDQQQMRKELPDFAISPLKAIIAYFSDHLSFIDPIDRLSYVQKCKSLVAALFLELDDGSTSSVAASRAALVTRCGTLNLVLANQIHQISKHDSVPRQFRDEMWSLVQRIAQRTLGRVTMHGWKELLTCMSGYRRADSAGDMMRDEHTSIEALVVSWHVLTQDLHSMKHFWGLVHFEIPARTLDGSFDITIPEDSWRRLFALLPFLELDSQGTLETGRRFHHPCDNWSIIKQLVSPVLEASLANPRGQSPSFNQYCRALFRRCLHLINAWGWRQCESIIGTLFDFFARNQLAHLRNEESHGSPLFLNHLGERPSLAAEPEDRCFHIFLKIVGSGIRHMQYLYSEKRIRDMIWRLMPNHDRTLPKEEAIRQSDLDALRNHHDLLCTLYWASPRSCRPRLAAIRDLVHLESSHREACHINIRAWFNLVKFQLSTNEPVDSLYGFRIWHDDLLVQIMRQHSLARTEAEGQVRSIQYTGSVDVPAELLESTIARNQRQVEAVLSDALVSLRLAVDVAQDEQAAAALVSTRLTQAFDLFYAGKFQSTKPAAQALDVLTALIRKCAEPPRLSPRSDDNDDSQDYGDWPILENDDGAVAATSKVTVESPLQKFQESLRHLLSNCFGSDNAPDDAFLLNIVDVWLALAHVLVGNGTKSWNDYLDPFGNDSWTSLRDTEQTRKYAAHYLASLIEKDPKSFADHAPFFLKSWVASLVERESLLKFQHQLTETLLNGCCDSSILKNPPFWRNAVSGCFEVSAAEFCERRLSLISSVLSNMRVSIEQAIFDDFANAAQLRHEYKDMLKHLMGTMKRNYQELGYGSNARGAYVDFVHKVIELLQQHTSAICPIDRFFTDSGAFPLPANDPTYVVGQLKSYAIRLQDSKTPKQLAVFLQSVSERAAIDGQQSYLVSQLHVAMSNSFEESISRRPTLRGFVVKAIVPAYIEMGCTPSVSCCGWILALPYLQALQKVFKEVLMDLDGANPSSVGAVASIATAFLKSVRQSVGRLLHSSGYLEEAGILKLTSACYSTVTALLPALDYLTRLSGSTQNAVKDIRSLRIFALFMSAQLQGHSDDDEIGSEDFADSEYLDTRYFAMQELKGTLTKNWTHVPRDQQYYFTKGTSRKEVVVDVGLWEEEKAALLDGFAGFLDSLRALPALNDEDDDCLSSGRNCVSALDQLIL